MREHAAGFTSPAVQPHAHAWRLGTLRLDQSEDFHAVRDLA